MSDLPEELVDEFAGLVTTCNPTKSKGMSSVEEDRLKRFFLNVNQADHDVSAELIEDIWPDHTEDLGFGGAADNDGLKATVIRFAANWPNGTRRGT